MRTLRTIAPLAAGAVALLSLGARSSLPATTQVSATPPAQVAEHLDTKAYRLLLDTKADALWYVTAMVNGPAELNEYSIASHSVTKYALPSSASDGYTITLALSPSGAVWVGLPYAVSRWDPTSKIVSTLALTEAVLGRTAGAEDPNAALDGTWISSIAAIGESVVVNRLNVPFLQIVSPQMAVSKGPLIPEAVMGSKEMAVDKSGNIALLPGYLSENATTQLRVVRPNGNVDTQPALDAYKLRTEPDGRVRVLSGGRSTFVDAGITSNAPPAAVGTLEDFYDSASTTYDPRRRAVIHQEGAATVTVQLDAVPTTAHGVSVVAHEFVTDVVTDQHGNSWMLRHNGTELAQIPSLASH